MEMKVNPQEDSFILVKFKEVGSTILDASANNVTPLQFLAIGQYFEFLGKNGLLREEAERQQQAEMQRIATPNPPKILLS